MKDLQLVAIPLRTLTLWMFSAALYLGSLSVVFADPSTAKDREALFEYIVRVTMERTAFSPTKPKDIGKEFGAGEDVTMAEFVYSRMMAYRQEMIDANTDKKLENVLLKLSAARWDSHLWVGRVDGGLPLSRSHRTIFAPIQFKPDYSDRKHIFLFVSDLPKDTTLFPGRVPEIGDKLVGVNGRNIDEYLKSFGRYIGLSSHRMHWWMLAHYANIRENDFPDAFYDGRNITYRLESRSGEVYQVKLAYLPRKEYRGLAWRNHDDPQYPGFEQVFSKKSFDLYASKAKKILIFRGHRFASDSLPQEILAAMKFARDNGGLDAYAVIYDLTRGRGGDLEEYTLQRLQPKPFKIMYGNLRISDITAALAKKLREQTLRNIEKHGKELSTPVFADAIEERNSGHYLLDWLDNDLARAIREKQAYSSAVQFKNQFLSTSSDGYLYPAKEHFKGPMVLFTNPHACSGADQFAAMFIENNLGLSVGMPEGGCTNTWEWSEILKFPISGKPVVRFMWTVGHSIGPANQIVEGNSAQPNIEVKLTRDNLSQYYNILLSHAYDYIDQVRKTGKQKPTMYERITHERVK